MDLLIFKLFLGNRNMVYGGNVGPQASRNYAKRIQETYDQFYRYDYLYSNPVPHVGSIWKDSSIQKDENRSESRLSARFNKGVTEKSTQSQF